MNADVVNILLGFVEGFLLILSPCILPVLPIILAGSIAGSKKRPVGIIVGFVIIFALFAFFSRKIVQYAGINLDFIRHISYGLLILLGLIMLSDYLSRKFSTLMQPLTKIGSSLSTANSTQGGFASGLWMGGLVAIVWTPCAGPILAAVIVQIVIQKTTLVSFLTLLAFAFGTAIPMFIITLYGLKLIETFHFLKKRTLFLRKIAGIIIIASVGYMIYQEQLVVSSSVAQTTIRTTKALEQGLWRPYPAPEISGIEQWINSPPLKLSDLKGKVVLIDFWTYSCINCVRTIPYLKNWYNRYHDKGLVIIGVHSPEFEFEKNVENVKGAVKRYGIDYPVALDNQFVTWRNYGNHFWPAHYLINKQGEVVYQHFGEGDYDVTENNIRFLAGIDNMSTSTTSVNTPLFHLETPETYLGYERAGFLTSPTLVHDKIAQYHFPEELPTNAWGLQGAWQVYADKIVSAEANAALEIHFNARNVYMVMGNSTAKPIQVVLRLNGKPLITDKGADVTRGRIFVDKHSLYAVIAQKELREGVLQIISKEPGLEIFTFTFGG